ncbi:MAG: hypothetical protein RIQ93_3383 [Verrucomicrobiota bacterium]|jgi:iron complex outermembrane receptor protein
MDFFRFPQWSPLMAILTASAAGISFAAETKTEMAPFKVEAEFGVDGLRIQNSNAVLNPYLLEQHGVAQLQDMSGLAPNLYTSNSDSRGFGDVLVLRGMANSIFFSAPAVALVVDDVPSGSVSSYPTALLAIDSFTVKAGSQSTDYGRNAPGGVIDIKTRAPGATQRGSVQIDYGSNNFAALNAVFDGPIADRLGYSLSVSTLERDGYIENTYRRRSADDRRSIAGRGTLYWKPGDDLQLRFGALVEKVDDAAVRLSSLFSPDPYVVASDLNSETKLDRLQLSFQAKKGFAWGTLIATTSHQDWEVDPASTDLDLSPRAMAFSRVAQSEKLWTQEFRFESKPDASRPKWRTGLFYSHSEIEGDALREFGVASPFLPPGFVQTERTIFGIGQWNLAAYGNIEQRVTSKSTVEIGARIEHVDSDLDRTKFSRNNFGFPSPPEPAITSGQRGAYLSLQAGAAHSVSDSLSLQARLSLAHKPEGYSGFSGNLARARFAGEQTVSGEAGLTFGPPKGRFGGSLLGFWNIIDRYQLERTVPGSTDFVVVNAAGVTARGFEAKFMWNPVERLWCDFQAGYTEATFDDHRDAKGGSVNGKRVPFVPKFTLRAGATVDLGRGFALNGSYAAVGRTYFDEPNTAMFSQKAYGVVNAQLRYRRGHWTATVYGHNLTRENYYQFINPEIYAGSPGAPRRYGAQLSFHY